MGRSIYTRRAINAWLAKHDDPLRSRLVRFRAGMEADRFRSSTIRQWLSQARLLLLYLARQGKELSEVQPSDIEAFIKVRLKLYRKRLGRAPTDLAEWRCSYTGAIHRLLRDIQGQWPPPTASALRINVFKSHLLSRGLDSSYVGVLCCHARQFAEYSERCGVSLEGAQPEQLAKYLSFAAHRNRKKNWYWMELHRRSVHELLRSVQGEWPPRN